MIENKTRKQRLQSRHEYEIRLVKLIALAEAYKKNARWLQEQVYIYFNKKNLMRITTTQEVFLIELITNGEPRPQINILTGEISLL